MRSRHEAQEFQRREQQGLGKPIISAEIHDQRIVAVGSDIHFSRKWRTFHDFLSDYPKIVLGKDWWMSEVKKAPEDRHRILLWAERTYEQANVHLKNKGPGIPLPATGAIESYMHFAYDLYCLKHANEVEKLMIDRLKCPDNFPGAMYEVRVAATMLRAGFNLSFEDETSRRNTHVEFIATHNASGAKFSVEAKRGEGERMKINRQLSRALCKHADHPRIVFIDTNDDNLKFCREGRRPLALLNAEKQLKLFERDPKAKGLPQAYVFVTYSPSEHHLEAVDLPSAMLFWGFHLEDLHPGYKTLLERVKTRRQHPTVFGLIDSMQKHRHIPVTFDGESAALAGGPAEARLLVGRRIEVPRPTGEPIEVTLESGVVIPTQKSALCGVCSDDQKRFFVQVPLTDDELQAYAQHPATFFGVIDSNAGRTKPKDELDWFDFFWDTYSLSPKEKLLSFLHRAPDIELLKNMTQEEVATEYCARMVHSIMSRPSTISNSN